MNYRDPAIPYPADLVLYPQDVVHTVEGYTEKEWWNEIAAPSFHVMGLTHASDPECVDHYDRYPERGQEIIQRVIDVFAANGPARWSVIGYYACISPKDEYGRHNNVCVVPRGGRGYLFASYVKFRVVFERERDILMYKLITK